MESPCPPPPTQAPPPKRAGGFPIFLKSAVGILLATSVAKAVGATGNAPLLALPDPILGLSNRTTLLGTAVLELVIAVWVLCRSKDPTTYLVLLWFGSLLLTYRAFSAVLVPGRPCPCLGSLTERLGLSTDAANYLMLGTVLYLVSGSCLGWMRSHGPRASVWSQGKHNTATAQS